MQCAILIGKGYGRTYMRAVAGLIRMIPALPRDRALARRIRRRPDRELLTSAPLIIRDDLASNAMIRSGKRAYEAFLDGYWRVLRRLVLRA
jgi:hypothetical protein